MAKQRVWGARLGLLILITIVPGACQVADGGRSGTTTVLSTETIPLQNSAILPSIHAIDNPRSVAIGTDGNVYVADSGVLGEPHSGRVLRWVGEEKLEIAFGEFSTELAGTSENPYMVGVSDATVWKDSLLILTGFGAYMREPLYADNRVLSVSAKGEVQELFSVGNFEVTHDPDGLGWDSNAASIAVPNDEGDAIWVSDAAGNWAARLVARDAGDYSLAVESLAVFPSVEGHEAVPTGIAVDSDGNAYVTLFRCQTTTVGSNLGGVAQLHTDGSYEIMVTGLANPIDVGFDTLGRMYVLEFGSGYRPETGSLLRIDNGQAVRILDGLTFPTSMAIADNGNIFITEMASPSGGIAGSGRLLVYELLALS